MSREMHIVVSGKVQGVFFRASVKARAEAEDIRGYARNLPNGTVEIVLQGSPERLEGLRKWISRGPGSSSISDMNVEIRPAGEPFEGFEIL